MKNKNVVVLRLIGLPVPQKIERAKYIVDTMTGNASFPTPNPDLNAVTDKISKLESSYIAAQKGGKDDTAAMHAAERELELILKSLGAYVEAVANSDPQNAEAIILSSGMGIKNPPAHVAKEFEVSHTGISGEVKVITRHVQNATFIFQMSTDTVSESNWKTISHTTRAKFVQSELTVGTKYFFRVAVVNKNGQGPWSIVKSILVI